MFQGAPEVPATICLRNSRRGLGLGLKSALGSMDAIRDSTQFRTGGRLPFPECNPPTAHVIRTDFDRNTVAGHDTDSEFSHLTRQAAEDDMVHVVEFDPKRTANLFNHGSGELDDFFFAFLIVRHRTNPRLQGESPILYFFVPFPRPGEDLPQEKMRCPFDLPLSPNKPKIIEARCPVDRSFDETERQTMPTETPIIVQFDETIIATASASGGGARGILRLSGPESIQVLRELFAPTFRGGSESSIVCGSFFPWDRHRPVPVTLFFWPKGHGYTGEEAIEIHTVGSPPILEAMIAAICRSGNVRLATPGEFTMRAFLAGRIDLTQSEAVLGIIEATSDAALGTALDQLAGGIAMPLKELREALFDMLARLEAGFDFAEEDIEFVSVAEIRRLLESTSERMESIRRKMTGRRLNDAKPRIVLIGPPNAGKTTLFNELLGSERGIVSPMAGTTRDYLEADWCIDGIPCVLVDTAGLGMRSVDASVQELSSTAAAAADLVLYCIETGAEPNLNAFRQVATERILLVPTKGTTTTEEVRTRIAARLRTSFLPCEVVASTAVRCCELLDRANQALDSARKLLDGLFDEVLVASEIRGALDALGEVVGDVHSDDLLNRIFSRFCIGK